MNLPGVCILLSTYRGEAFIAAQLDSLIAQTHHNWRLLVRDDGSTDGTLAMLHDYARRDARITVMEDDFGNVGACQSFALLFNRIVASKPDYLMFCDQDDVWFPEKIKVTLHKMVELEQKWGAEVPLLVHTDLFVVDKRLRPLSPSFWRYQHLSPHFNQLNRLLMQNVVTGCTSLLNRALCEKIDHLPGTAIMHDAWVGLVASAFGKVEFLPKATLYYRQHGHNEIGAKQWSIAFVIRKMLKPSVIISSAKRRQAQAALFFQHYQSALTVPQRKMVKALAMLSRRSFLVRRYYTWKYGLWLQGWVRNVALWIFV